MKKEDIDFLWYYLSKRIINNAEWDEARRRFYVKMENDYISFTAEEYKYLKRVAKME